MDRDEQREQQRKDHECSTEFSLSGDKLPPQRKGTDCDEPLDQPIPDRFLSPADCPPEIVEVLDPPSIEFANPETIATCPLPDQVGDPVIIPEGQITRRFNFSSIPDLTPEQGTYLARIEEDKLFSWRTTPILQLIQESSLTVNQAEFVFEELNSLYNEVREEAQRIAESLLDCYWLNSPQTVKCPEKAIKSEVPSSEITSGSGPVVYSYTVGGGTIKSYTSKNDANEQAIATAESNLICVFTAECVRTCFDLGFEDTVNAPGSVSEVEVTEDVIFASTLEAAQDRACELALSSLNCFYVNEEISLSCSGEFGKHDTFLPEGDYLNSVTGSSITIPAGEFSSDESQQDANDQARQAALNLLECYWIGDGEARCPDKENPDEDVNVYSPDPFGRGDEDPGILVLDPDISSTPPHEIDPETGEYRVVTFLGYRSDISQEDADETAQLLAESQLNCIYCNVQLDPKCIPPTENLSELPIPIPAGYGDDSWSLDATIGIPAGIFCSFNATNAQAPADSIGGTTHDPDEGGIDGPESCRYGNNPVRAACDVITSGEDFDNSPLTAYKFTEEEIEIKGELSSNSTQGFVEVAENTFIVTDQDIPEDFQPGADIHVRAKNYANYLATNYALQSLSCFWENTPVVRTCPETTVDNISVSEDKPESCGNQEEELNKVGVDIFPLPDDPNLPEGDIQWEDITAVEDLEISEERKLRLNIIGEGGVNYASTPQGTFISYTSQCEADSLALSFVNSIINCVYSNNPGYYLCTNDVHTSGKYSPLNPQQNIHEDGFITFGTGRVIPRGNDNINNDDPHGHTVSRISSGSYINPIFVPENMFTGISPEEVESQIDALVLSALNCVWTNNNRIILCGSPTDISGIGTPREEDRTNYPFDYILDTGADPPLIHEAPGLPYGKSGTLTDPINKTDFTLTNPTPGSYYVTTGGLSAGTNIIPTDWLELSEYSIGGPNPNGETSRSYVDLPEKPIDPGTDFPDAGGSDEVSGGDFVWITPTYIEGEEEIEPSYVYETIDGFNINYFYGAWVQEGTFTSEQDPDIPMIQALILGVSMLDCFYENDQIRVECPVDKACLRPVETHEWYHDGIFANKITIRVGEVRSYISKEDANTKAIVLAKTMLDCTYKSTPRVVACTELDTEEDEVIRPEYPDSCEKGDCAGSEAREKPPIPEDLSDVPRTNIFESLVEDDDSISDDDKCRIKQTTGLVYAEEGLVRSTESQCDADVLRDVILTSSLNCRYTNRAGNYLCTDSVHVSSPPVYLPLNPINCDTEIPTFGTGETIPRGNDWLGGEKDANPYDSNGKYPLVPPPAEVSELSLGHPDNPLFVPEEMFLGDTLEEVISQLDAFVLSALDCFWANNDRIILCGSPINEEGIGIKSSGSPAEVTGDLTEFSNLVFPNDVDLKGWQFLSVWSTGGPNPNGDTDVKLEYKTSKPPHYTTKHQVAYLDINTYVDTENQIPPKGYIYPNNTVEYFGAWVAENTFTSDFGPDIPMIQALVLGTSMLDCFYGNAELTVLCPEDPACIRPIKSHRWYHQGIQSQQITIRENEVFSYVSKSDANIKASLLAKTLLDCTYFSRPKVYTCSINDDPANTNDIQVLELDPVTCKDCQYYEGDKILPSTGDINLPAHWQAYSRTSLLASEQELVSEGTLDPEQALRVQVSKGVFFAYGGLSTSSDSQCDADLQSEVMAKSLLVCQYTNKAGYYMCTDKVYTDNKYEPLSPGFNHDPEGEIPTFGTSAAIPLGDNYLYQENASVFVSQRSVGHYRTPIFIEENTFFGSTPEEVISQLDAYVLTTLRCVWTNVEKIILCGTQPYNPDSIATCNGCMSSNYFSDNKLVDLTDDSNPSDFERDTEGWRSTGIGGPYEDISDLTSEQFYQLSKKAKGGPRIVKWKMQSSGFEDDYEDFNGVYVPEGAFVGDEEIDQLHIKAMLQGMGGLDCFYGNDPLSISCEYLGPPGIFGEGEVVRVTIPRDEFRSYVSKEDANNKAYRYALSMLSCLYINGNGQTIIRPPVVIQDPFDVANGEDNPQNDYDPCIQVVSTPPGNVDTLSGNTISQDFCLAIQIRADNVCQDGSPALEGTGISTYSTVLANLASCGLGGGDEDCENECIGYYS